MVNQYALTTDKKRRKREPEDYDPKEPERKSDPKVVAAFKPKGELSVPTGIRNDLRSAALSGASQFGLSPERQRYVADTVGDVADFIPGVGESIATKEIGEDLGSGSYGSAALNTAGLALGAVPVVGDIAAKGLKKGAQKVSQYALAKEAAPVAKKAKQEAITAVSLRDKPLAEAIDIAKSERHIIPKAEGGFVGAPYSAKTRADLDMIRQKFDADVAAGASGADWYPRAQEWIKQVAGDDPNRQSELARNLALFSAQADPGGNLGFSITARNNAIMGMTPKSSEGKEGVVRTGQQWDTYKQAYDANASLPPQIGHNGGPPIFEEIALGPKTGIYAGHMDPTKVNPTTGTNDIWHARALGYETPEGKPWESALTPQQHSFMDAETVLAVDRANQAGIGGRTDWNPGEIQAAPWVTGKGRGLAERRGMSLEEGLAEASKTYPDYAPAYTAYGTHEMTPGRSTGHLPSIANGDQATRDAFAEGPGNWWQNDQGKDVLYDAQGGYGTKSKEAIGIYGDPTQFNPMQAARPMVSFSGPTGERVIEPASRQMMQGTEGFRAAMDAQDAGAWNIPLAGQKASHNNAFLLDLPGPATRELLAEIQAAGARQGMGDVVHYGDNNKALLTQFWPEAKGQGAKQAKAMQQALGDRAKVTPTRRESDIVDYTDEWRGGAKEGAPKQGTDMVTQKMLAEIDKSPTQAAALDKPEVRAKVLERFDRDAAVAAERGDVVRGDLQALRKAFAEGGFAAVRKGLGQGLFPAVAAGVLLNQLREPAGGQARGGSSREGA